VRNTVILGVVSGIYLWRAKTEEAHLMAEDAKYREYHAWMGANAPIPRGFSRVFGLLTLRRGQLQPAE
jgi:hypothetical protein